MPGSGSVINVSKFATYWWFLEEEHTWLPRCWRDCCRDGRRMRRGQYWAPPPVQTGWWTQCSPPAGCPCNNTQNSLKEQLTRKVKATISPVTGCSAIERSATTRRKLKLNLTNWFVFRLRCTVKWTVSSSGLSSCNSVRQRNNHRKKILSRIVTKSTAKWHIYEQG